MNIFDTINNLVSQAGVAFRGVVGLGAAIVFFVVAAKVKWAVGTTLLTGIMAAAVIFFVAGGLEWVSGMLGNTVQTSN